MKSLLQFLFGKSPQIFDDKGQVYHQLPKDKWDAWSARYKDDSHNWQRHSGTQRPAQRPVLKPKN